MQRRFDVYVPQQVSKYGHQDVCELIRQHLDDGGFYHPTNFSWRYVRNMSYIATAAPSKLANETLALSQRLLRHFSILSCSYPQ